MRFHPSRFVTMLDVTRQTVFQLPQDHPACVKHRYTVSAISTKRFHLATSNSVMKSFNSAQTVEARLSLGSCADRRDTLFSPGPASSQMMLENR